MRRFAPRLTSFMIHSYLLSLACRSHGSLRGRHETASSWAQRVAMLQCSGANCSVMVVPATNARCAVVSTRRPGKDSPRLRRARMVDERSGYRGLLRPVRSPQCRQTRQFAPPSQRICTEHVHPGAARGPRSVHELARMRDHLKHFVQHYIRDFNRDERTPGRRRSSSCRSGHTPCRSTTSSS